MARSESNAGRLPRGVTALPRARGGRKYRARIRRGKGVEVHLGLYATPWLAAFAYDAAARAIGRASGTPVEIPRAAQPTADEVREITALVRRRLGLDPPPVPPADDPPTADALLTLLEVTVVGFWRDQAAHPEGHPDAALDAAARRLVEAARVLCWCHSAGHPTAPEALADLLAHRLDRAFRRADLTREVLDDDGDDPHRVARWLVHPDAFPDGRARGFRDEVAYRYPDAFEAPAPTDAPASWSSILGLTPPFTAEQIRLAYRARSRAAHPDAGGSHEDFVRLRRAYEQARRYCERAAD